jgi:hypothetical protein
MLTKIAAATLALALTAGAAAAAERTVLAGEEAPIASGLIPPGDLTISGRYDCRMPGAKSMRGTVKVVVGNDLTVRTGEQAGALEGLHAERDFNRFRLYAASPEGFSCTVTTSY